MIRQNLQESCRETTMLLALFKKKKKKPTISAFLRCSLFHRWRSSTLNADPGYTDDLRGLDTSYPTDRPFSALQTSSRTLKSIFLQTGSQCSDLRTGVMWSIFLVLVRTHLTWTHVTFQMGCSCLSIIETCKDTITVLTFLVPCSDRIAFNFASFLRW